MPCRKSKGKCDHSKPTCQRCQTRNLLCTWPQGKVQSLTQQRKPKELPYLATKVELLMENSCFHQKYGSRFDQHHPIRYLARISSYSTLLTICFKALIAQDQVATQSYNQARILLRKCSRMDHPDMIFGASLLLCMYEVSISPTKAACPANSLHCSSRLVWMREAI